MSKSSVVLVVNHGHWGVACSLSYKCCKLSRKCWIKRLPSGAYTFMNLKWNEQYKFCVCFYNYEQVMPQCNSKTLPNLLQMSFVTIVWTVAVRQSGWHTRCIAVRNMSGQPCVLCPFPTQPWTQPIKLN
jgi:hypothetical protein